MLNYPQATIQGGNTNEYCVRVGRIAADDAEIDEHRRSNAGQDCGDWGVLEGTREDIIELARYMLAIAPANTSGAIQRKTARSILEYLDAEIGGGEHG